MKTRFHALLEQKINEEIGAKVASVANGSAADYAEYKFWVGYVRGLNAALNLCDEIEREADGSSGAPSGN